ncbi:hypothetical protein [Paenibacillus sp. IHBB 10380]|uniref:hypothetical protein n=1 Tax=Paenibacillus sp. IHBB 10380 TaxID=1566358 RepID=UPI0005CFADB4|nr:hypothetical protein [Paenibacillus sp. IHBB 10380]
MIEYNICNQADEAIFEKQCFAFEKKIPGLIKKELLHDVDDSKVQYYKLGESSVTVHNDYYVNAVYVKSEIDLEQFFK